MPLSDVYVEFVRPQPEYPDQFQPLPDPLRTLLRRSTAAIMAMAISNAIVPPVTHAHPTPPPSRSRPGSRYGKLPAQDLLAQVAARTPHRSLDLQPPRPTPRLTLVESRTVNSPVQRVDVLGGLIHEYRHAA